MQIIFMRNWDIIGCKFRNWKYKQAHEDIFLFERHLVYCCTKKLPLLLLQQLWESSKPISLLLWRHLLGIPSTACQFHDTLQSFFPLPLPPVSVADATPWSSHVVGLAIPILEKVNKKCPNKTFQQFWFYKITYIQAKIHTHSTPQHLLWFHIHQPRRKLCTHHFGIIVIKQKRGNASFGSVKVYNFVTLVTESKKIQKKTLKVQSANHFSPKPKRLCDSSDNINICLRTKVSTRRLILGLNLPPRTYLF